MDRRELLKWAVAGALGGAAGTLLSTGSWCAAPPLPKGAGHDEHDRSVPWWFEVPEVEGKEMGSDDKGSYYDIPGAGPKLHLYFSQGDSRDYRVATLHKLTSFRLYKSEYMEPIDRLWSLPYTDDSVVKQLAENEDLKGFVRWLGNCLYWSCFMPVAKFPKTCRAIGAYAEIPFADAVDLFGDDSLGYYVVKYATKNLDFRGPKDSIYRRLLPPLELNEKDMVRGK
jgi:hypothetical protein